MPGHVHHQALLLEERCIALEVHALMVEASMAGDMIGSAQTAQAQKDSILYTEQVLNEITALETKLYAVQAKILALSGAEPEKPHRH